MNTPVRLRSVFQAGTCLFALLLFTHCNNDDDRPDAPPPPNTPELTTAEVSEIGLTTAVSGGNITDDNGATVTARGLCWGTEPNPTVADSSTVNGSGAGSFTGTLTGLEPNTNYFVRAYATSARGTGYGSTYSFQTLDDTYFEDERDGNFYKTVTIGDQAWMAENLRFLPLVHPPSDGSPGAARYYVYGYYGNNVSEARLTENYATYGALYNWPAAMSGEGQSNTNPSNVQGICPDGWHLPSFSEYTALRDYLGGGAAAGGKLKETDTEHWVYPNTGATNESGFSGLPGGFRSTDDDFFQVGIVGIWWTATEEMFTTSYYFSVQYNAAFSDHFGLNQDYGCCVRCVRD